VKLGTNVTLLETTPPLCFLRINGGEDSSRISLGCDAVLPWRWRAHRPRWHLATTVHGVATRRIRVVTFVSLPSTILTWRPCELTSLKRH